MDFKTIIGHSKQLNYLKKLALSGKIPQAMLFCGNHGIGKKLIAHWFFNSLLCKQPTTPCGTCSICRQFTAGSFPDFIYLGPNEKGKIAIGKKGENLPGSVRWLIGRLSRQPIFERYVIIIDGIEKISEEGQNALLKTIEEPGRKTNLILISSSRSQILPTIISRCMEINFSPLTSGQLLKIILNGNSPNSHTEFLALISGGSLENLQALQNKETFNEIYLLAEKIKNTFIARVPFNFDITALQKKVQNPDVIEILINIFSEILRINIKKCNDYNPLFDKLYIDDSELIHKLVKILFILKKAELNNINQFNALKGMLYYDFSDKNELHPLMNQLNIR